jgi:hypothetical protein
MDSVREFVEWMIEEIEQDMELQRKKDPNDEWMAFLEGNLLAMKLVKDHVEHEESRK